MDILLVNSFHETHIHSFSWGVLSNASYLKSKGFSVKILDGSYYTMKRKAFYAELDQLSAQTKLIGFTCFSTDTYEIKQMIDFIKTKRPEVKIILGGPHAVLLPDQTCQYRHIDFVAYGNGEKTLESLINKVNSGEENYDRVPGLVYEDRGRIKRTPAAPMVDFYNIDYSLLPKEKIETYGRYMQVLTGRGCSFRCTFCFNAITGQKWLPRPVEDVMNEISMLVDRYGTRNIYFRDENFFQSKERILDFIRLYKEMGFSFKWRATTRANYFKASYINIDFLKELEAINCQELKFGLESGSERVLTYLRKGIRVEKVRKTIANMAKVNIRGNYSFLIGIPSETMDEFKETIGLIKYIKDTDPDANVIGPQYYRVYPGGELYDDIINNYNYSKPGSFEDWAQSVKSDSLGMDKDVEYPWLTKAQSDVAKYSDMMMLLYGKKVQELLTWKKFAVIPFAALARFRVKSGWFGFLADMKLFSFLFKKLHLYY